MKTVALALLIFTLSAQVVIAQDTDIRLDLNLLGGQSNDGWAIVNDGNMNAYLDLDLAASKPPPRLLVKLGMSLKQVDSEVIHDHLPLEEGTGMVVDNLLAKLPANKAGISINDIIAKVDGKPIRSTDEFVQFYEATESDEVAIEFIQKAKVKIVSVSKTAVEEASKRYLIGVHVDVVPSALAKHLGLEEKTGLYIKDVMDDLPAKKTGIKSGDILVKIEDESVNTVQELNQKIQKAGATAVTLELLRRGDTVMVEVTPAEDDSHLELTTANLSGFEYLVYPKSVWTYGRSRQTQDSMKYFELSTTLEKLVEEVAQLREAIENKD